MLLTDLIKNAKKKMMHLLFAMMLKVRKAFKRLKTIFVNAFILKHYDWDADFCMKINALNHEVEDVLSQKSKTDQLLQAYQGWIELVSVSSSDLTQIWLSLYFLFSTSLCSTSSFFLHHILLVSQTHFLQA